MDISLLQILSSLPGISSRENAVAEEIIAILNEYGYECIQDGLGSVLCCVHKAEDEVQCRTKLMLVAHMDEVGFIVEDITDDGFIKLLPVGSWWTHMVAGQLFELHTCDGRVYTGMIESYPTHGIPKEIKERTMSVDELYLDLGISSHIEAREKGISKGDMVCPHPSFQKLPHEGRLINKAFDDRYGCCILLEIAKKISSLSIPSNLEVTLAFTVQEEPGLRGARTAGATCEPDIAIALDTTIAGDTPFASNTVRLGAGVTISMLDSNALYHRGLMLHLEDICKRNNIDHQYAVFSAGGTDMGNIQKLGHGCMGITLSLPIRAMHTCHSMIDIHDGDCAIDLLTRFIAALSNDQVYSLANY